MLKKIGAKLLLSYIVLLIITFSVNSITYHFLSRGYLVNETRKTLKSESQAIAQLLKNAPLKSSEIKLKLANKVAIKVAERFMEADMLILNKDKTIVYKSIEEFDKKTLLQLTKGKSIASRNFVGERAIIYDQKGETKGYVILFAKLQSLYGLNKLMRGAEFVSILVTAFVMLIISLFFEKSIVHPIEALISKIDVYSETKQPNEISIKTGDEIQQLDECFVAMTKSMALYDETQKRFLQNTSHELKTPLMSIQGYAEAMKDGIITGPEMEEGLEIIIDQSQKLKRIVEELIYLTKLGNPEEKLRKEQTDLKELIYSVGQSLKPLLEAKNLHLSMDDVPQLLIKCDREKMNRALLNLLSNAIRYAASTITIEAHMSANSLFIKIKDDGPGFKNGEQSNVFERFYKGTGGNTGLGLAIVKAIIEVHHGSITAYNGAKGGAVFEMNLPNK